MTTARDDAEAVTRFRARRAQQPVSQPGTPCITTSLQQWLRGHRAGCQRVRSAIGSNKSPRMWLGGSLWVAGMTRGAPEPNKVSQAMTAMGRLL